MNSLITMHTEMDVIIIGAGFAGLSAALFLGNARRKVLLIDWGKTRNHGIAHAHNILGHEGSNPSEFLETARQEISTLSSVQTIHAKATKLERLSDGTFRVMLHCNAQYHAKALILATGLKDQLPTIPGLAPFWPKNLFHCPYCIAPELIDAPLGVICETSEAFFLSSIVQKWTRDLILFINDSADISETDRNKMANRGIQIISDPILEASDAVGESLYLHFENRSPCKRRGVFMHLNVEQVGAALLQQLNIALRDDALVEVDEQFQTRIPYLYAIGDMAQPVQKVTTAIASGTIAGFGLDHQLTEWEMQKP